MRARGAHGRARGAHGRARARAVVRCGPVRRSARHTEVTPTKDLCSAILAAYKLGRESHAPSRASMAAAARSGVPSSNSLPMSVTERGWLGAAKPARATTHGCPQALVSSSICPANGGHTTQSAWLKNSCIACMACRRMRDACTAATAGMNHAGAIDHKDVFNISAHAHQQTHAGDGGSAST